MCLLEFLNYSLTLIYLGFVFLANRISKRIFLAKRISKRIIPPDSDSDSDFHFLENRIRTRTRIWVFFYYRFRIGLGFAFFRKPDSDSDSDFFFLRKRIRTRTRIFKSALPWGGHGKVLSKCGFAHWNWFSISFCFFLTESIDSATITFYEVNIVRKWF